MFPQYVSTVFCEALMKPVNGIGLLGLPLGVVSGTRSHGLGLTGVLSLRLLEAGCLRQVA